MHASMPQIAVFGLNSHFRWHLHIFFAAHIHTPNGNYSSVCMRACLHIYYIISQCKQLDSYSAKVPAVAHACMCATFILQHVASSDDIKRTKIIGKNLSLACYCYICCANKYQLVCVSLWRNCVLITESKRFYLIKA